MFEIIIILFELLLKNKKITNILKFTIKVIR